MSVCIATIGRPSLTARALPSVAGAVASGLAEVVVVVDEDRVDPGSLRGVEGLPGVRVVHHRGGPGAVRNAGVAASVGEFVSFLDDDDELHPTWSAVVGPHLRADHIDLLSGTADVVGDDGIRRHRPHETMSYLHGDRRATFLAGSFVVRRRRFLEVGGYDERFTNSENWELAIRLLDAVDEGLVELRVVEDPLVVQYPSRAPSDYRSRPVAQLMLAKYAERIQRSPATRSLYEAQVGVGYLREGAPGPGRRAFVRSLRHSPVSAAAWGRLLVALVPSLAHRRWPPYPPGTA